MVYTDAVKMNPSTRDVTKRDVEVSLSKWFGNARDRKGGGRTKRTIDCSQSSGSQCSATVTSREVSVTTPRHGHCMGTPPDKLPRFSLWENSWSECGIVISLLCWMISLHLISFAKMTVSVLIQILFFYFYFLNS